MHELTIECQLGVVRHRRGRKELLADAPPQTEVPEGRVPRVARLMALAIRFDGLVRSGEINDYAALARLGCVTRARMTQIMNLLMLAPDIQETLLFLPVLYKIVVGRNRRRNLRLMDAYKPRDCQREKDRKAVEGDWRTESHDQEAKSAQPRGAIAKEE